MTQNNSIIEARPPRSLIIDKGISTLNEKIDIFSLRLLPSLYVVQYFTCIAHFKVETFNISAYIKYVALKVAIYALENLEPAVLHEKS